MADLSDLDSSDYDEDFEIDHDDYIDGEWVTCWYCHGQGGFDLYDEDPLWYDKDDFEICTECKGNGGWFVPFTEEVET